MREEEVQTVLKVTWIGFAGNLILSILKGIGGYLGHSHAVMADAVHSLTDIVSDIAILIGARYWSKPADDTHPHGHRRIETVVTVGIGILLFLIATSMAVDGLRNIQSPEATPPGWIAFWAAFISLVVKEGLYRYTYEAGEKIRSIALIANAWHHRSDALGSIPVLIAVLVAKLKPGWEFVDSVGEVLVSILIFQAAFKIIIPGLNKLVDGGAPEEKLTHIEELVLCTEGVKSFHKLRTRYVGSHSLAIDLHIQVEGELSVTEGHDICGAAKARILKGIPEVVDVIVHLEPFEEEEDDDSKELEIPEWEDKMENY
jgi:cation diffusion facilitator family transporter